MSIMQLLATSYKRTISIMSHQRWTTYDLVFFDCDSTLSTIEGIDELAKLKGQEDSISVLTNKAMNGELDLSEVYGKRLEAINPTRGELKVIEDRYWETIVEDAQEVIKALQYLGKQVFIISGGLAEAVRGFGVRLGVDASHIRAVELEYNQLSGEWWRYHEPQTQHAQKYLEYVEGPLTISSGKPRIINELAGNKPGRRMMIGDGSSDLATSAVVDLFVGFGGVVARDNVKSESRIFVESGSLAPILPIATGIEGYNRIKDSIHQPLFDKGLAIVMNQKEVFFKSEETFDLFKQVFQPNDEGIS